MDTGKSYEPRLTGEHVEDDVVWDVRQIDSVLRKLGQHKRWTEHPAMITLHRVGAVQLQTFLFHAPLITIQCNRMKATQQNPLELEKLPSSLSTVLVTGTKWLMRNICREDYLFCLVLWRNIVHHDEEGMAVGVANGCCGRSMRLLAHISADQEAKHRDNWSLLLCILVQDTSTWDGMTHIESVLFSTHESVNALIFLLGKIF